MEQHRTVPDEGFQFAVMIVKKLRWNAIISDPAASDPETSEAHLFTRSVRLLEKDKSIVYKNLLIFNFVDAFLFRLNVVFLHECVHAGQLHLSSEVGVHAALGNRCVFERIGRVSKLRAPDKDE